MYFRIFPRPNTYGSQTRYHHIEERRFSVAALWSLFGAVLSATGMIYTFTLDGNDLCPRSAGPCSIFKPQGSAPTAA